MSLTLEGFIYLADQVEAMVTDGYLSIEELAVALKVTKHDIRTALKMRGLSIDEDKPLAMEWCDRCCHPRSKLDKVTGWCLPCTTKMRLEQQRIADDEEEERLMQEAQREANQVKKARERMREEYGANPRKGRTEQ